MKTSVRPGADRYRIVVAVPFDRLKRAIPAIRRGLALAADDPHAHLTFLVVLPRAVPGVTMPLLSARLLGVVDGILARSASLARRDAIVRSGDLLDCVAAFVASERPALLVVGETPVSFERWQSFGSASGIVVSVVDRSAAPAGGRDRRGDARTA